MIDEKLLEVIKKHLNEIGANDITDFDKDLKDMGLDSLGSINLLLDIEEAYDIVIPDEYLTDETFSTANTLWELIKKVKTES
ncbi:phosphopantetheine-binding protein [Bacillus cereus]|uniref:phosphopantetheine-binding protein n=1 Tax=Bacillus cereus TaxID=1396 RepID=UPI002EDB8A66